MPIRSYRLTGRVQGVGFRAAVSRCANQLGLDGYVRNNPDGSVTSVAEGSAEKLDLFEVMLRNSCGSFMARVDELSVTELESGPAQTGFHIR
ncbi:MAG: acylphosphatase [Chitinophagales bacterium]